MDRASPRQAAGLMGGSSDGTARGVGERYGRGRAQQSVYMEHAVGLAWKQQGQASSVRLGPSGPLFGSFGMLEA